MTLTPLTDARPWIVLCSQIPVTHEILVGFESKLGLPDRINTLVECVKPCLVAPRDGGDILHGEISLSTAQSAE